MEQEVKAKKKREEAGFSTVQKRFEQHPMSQNEAIQISEYQKFEQTQPVKLKRVMPFDSTVPRFPNKFMPDPYSMEIPGPGQYDPKE